MVLHKDSLRGLCTLADGLATVTQGPFPPLLPVSDAGDFPAPFLLWPHYIRPSAQEPALTVLLRSSEEREGGLKVSVSHASWDMEI